MYIYIHPLIQIPKILPVVFKNTFPELDTLNHIFCVCKTWHAQKEITWKAIVEDSEYPIFKKYQILYAVLLQENFDRVPTDYQKIEKPFHSTNTTFLRDYNLPLSDIRDLKALMDQNEFEQAFAGSRTPELQRELQQYLIDKVGYDRALQLILLFNEGKNLTNWCITFLTEGSGKLELLIKLNNQELPEKLDLENFLKHPFILSLKRLKGRILDVEVFDAYNKLFILPTLSYFPQLRNLFEILPDDFSFDSSSDVNEEIFDFFERFLKPVSVQNARTLEKNKLNFIPAVQLVPHPRLRTLVAEFHLDKFYSNYADEVDVPFTNCWPHLYQIEHALDCQTLTPKTGKIINFDRSTETYIEYLLLDGYKFSKVFESNFNFASAVARLFEKDTHLLDEIIKDVEEHDEAEFDKEYIHAVFVDILELLNKHLKPHYIRNGFIDSAPAYLKSDLLKLNSKS